MPIEGLLYNYMVIAEVHNMKAKVSGNPTIPQVQSEAVDRGIEAIWDSEWNEWIIKLPDTPEVQWKYAKTNRDALIEIRKMGRALRRKRFIPRTDEQQGQVGPYFNIRNGGTYPTVREFLTFVHKQSGSRKIYQSLGGYMYRMNKTELFNMIAYKHEHDSDEELPFQLDINGGGYILFTVLENTNVQQTPNQDQE